MLDAQVRAICREELGRPSDNGTVILNLESGLEAMTREIMTRAVHVCGGSYTRAAGLLGISRKTLYNRIGPKFKKEG